MNIIETAEILIDLHKSLDELNQEYKAYKIRMNQMFEYMILAKQAVKKYQVCYWNNIIIRESLDYKLCYNATVNLYDEIKKAYSQYCGKLKLLKLQIKDRQRQISQINYELRNDY